MSSLPSHRVHSLLLLSGLILHAIPAGAAAAEHTPATPPASERTPGLRPGVRLMLSLELEGEYEIEDFGFTIRPDGTAVLPLIDEVDFRSKSIREAAAALLEEYQRFYVPVPRIMLQLAEGQEDAGIWGHVTVVGRVKQPGRISLPSTREISLSEIIARAGGFDTSAKLSSIRITRRNNGSATTTTVDLGDEKDAADTYDLLLKHGDVVQIPERMF